MNEAKSTAVSISHAVESAVKNVPKSVGNSVADIKKNVSTEAKTVAKGLIKTAAAAASEVKQVTARASSNLTKAVDNIKAAATSKVNSAKATTVTIGKDVQNSVKSVGNNLSASMKSASVHEVTNPRLAARDRLPEAGEEATKSEKKMFSAAVSSIPIIGEAKDIAEVVTGKDAITKEDLTLRERALTAVGLVLPVVGGSAVRQLAEGAIAYGMIKSGMEIGQAAGDLGRVGGKEVIKGGSGSLAGANRAGKFAENWQQASLDDAVEKFAQNAKPVTTSSGKTLLKNEDTGIQVVYDKSGNYFRIEDTTLTGKRRYLDLDGNNVSNKIVDGKQIGRTKDEYEAITHFLDMK